MSEPETEQVEAPATDFILVALDASPHSEAALAAAVELAAALHLELHGLFVEDIDLLHLYGLPFGLEIGSFTATPRRLERTHLEREFRVQATTLRKIMADVAGKRRITWSFQVVRGGVTDALLEAAASARMLSLGRVGRTPGKRTGSTAQAVARNTQRPVLIQSADRKLTGPFTVLYTGTVAADNSVALALQLAVQEKSSITLLLYGDSAEVERVEQQLADFPVETSLQHFDEQKDVLAHLRAVSSGAVILPVDAATWLEDIPATVIVVP